MGARMKIRAPFSLADAAGARIRRAGEPDQASGK
jgi:hypothetical protein